MYRGQKIVPFLWFDDHAERVADFYVSLFDDARTLEVMRYGEAAAEASGQPAGAVMMVTFQLGGQVFAALNGARQVPFTPATSFFVSCETEAEVDRLFAELSAGGDVLLGLDSYPFSRRYGWVEDRFGVSWQVGLVEGRRNARVTPCLLFVGEQRGRAEEAMNRYVSLLGGSRVLHVDRYAEGDREETPGTVRHAAFELAGQPFVVMDSAREHDFGFTPAVSFLVNCETQGEVDRLWQALGEGGRELACGWLTDRHGVTWQVVPAALHALLRDPERGERVMRAMVAMKKLDLPTLERA